MSGKLLNIRMSRKEAEELLEVLKHNATHLYSNNWERTVLCVHISDYIKRELKDYE